MIIFLLIGYISIVDVHLIMSNHSQIYNKKLKYIFNILLYLNLYILVSNIAIIYTFKFILYLSILKTIVIFVLHII